jgi:Rieske Fe-S protein
MDSQPKSKDFEKSVPTLTRRGALCALAVVTLGLIPKPAVAASGVKVLKNGRVVLSLVTNRALSKVGGVVQIDNLNGRSIALIRTGKGKKAFTALDLRCTHEGEIVAQQGALWSCPRHGATFDLAGALKIGPANTSLRKLRVRVKAKKVVIS